MSDLISRQAAIDALMEIMDRPKHADFLYTDEICKTLNDLPSAQPDVTGINVGDMVSRQAAIEEVHGAIYEFFDICDDDEESPMTYKDEKLLEINKAISGRIKALPSAQPEIIRCKDCRFATLTYDGDCKYCQYLEGEFGLTDAVYFDGNDYCSHAERRTNE